jgi:hypothetical protein
VKGERSGYRCQSTKWVARCKVECCVTRTAKSTFWAMASRSQVLLSKVPGMSVDTVWEQDVGVAASYMSYKEG